MSYHNLYDDDDEKLNGGAAGGGDIIECPSCSYPIVVSGNKLAKCPCCGNSVDVSKPKQDDGAALAQKVMGIRTVSAASAHIQYLFETYDWDSFSRDASRFGIPEIDVLLNTVRTEHGDDYNTWKISFDYKSECLSQKLKNINSNVEKIAVKYANGGDVDACHNAFDLLKDGVNILKSKQDALLNELTSFITYASRFGAPASEVSRMEKARDALKAEFDGIRIFESLENHPDVIKQLEKKREKSVAEYKQKGIDAPAVYDNAVRSCKAGKFAEACKLFGSIADYEDSSAYIAEMSKVHTTDRIAYMHNKIFYRSNGSLGNYLTQEKSMLDSRMYVTSLNVNKLLGLYGDKLFYLVENSSSIYYLDINADALPPKKFVPLKYTFYGKIYRPLAMRLLSKRRNCFIFAVSYDTAEAKAAKKAFCKAHNIPYRKDIEKLADNADFKDLVMLDAETGECSIIAEGVKHLLDDGASALNGNVIYYIAHTVSYKKKKVVGVEGCSLYSYNIESKETKQELAGNARIEYLDPQTSTVVYTCSDHDENNRSIFVRRNGIDNEIARNVYGFYKVIAGKIFYTVGNSEVRSLCSVGLDGKDSKEVMKYIERIVHSDDEWLYIIRGSGKYITLYRMSVTGGALQKIAFGVARADVETDFAVFEGYLYYTNYNSELCKVRLDGTGQTNLVKDVSAICGIHGGKIFYLCLDGYKNGSPVFSLYAMNYDGSDRRKLIFNLSELCNIGDNKLIFIRDETFESKRELYSHVEDKKLNKQIDKVFNKLDKKKKPTGGMFDVISLFDLDTMTTRALAYTEPYPTKVSLKNYLKGALSK